MSVPNMTNGCCSFRCRATKSPYFSFTASEPNFYISNQEIPEAEEAENANRYVGILKLN